MWGEMIRRSASAHTGVDAMISGWVRQRPCYTRRRRSRGHEKKWIIILVGGVAFTEADKWRSSVNTNFPRKAKIGLSLFFAGQPDQPHGSIFPSQSPPPPTPPLSSHASMPTRHNATPTRPKAIRAIDTALKLLPEHVAESTGIKRHRDNYQARVDKLT